MYDTQEQLVFDSGISVVVLGRAGDFVLIDLTRNLDDAVVESARARGFNYCGVLALVNGEPAAKCESDADAVYTMMHAGLVFTRMMADRLRQQPQGDSVAWLEKLWTLPSSPGLA